MQKIISLLFRFIAAIPLPLLHHMGNLIGTLAYHTQPKLRARIRENIQSAGIITDNTNTDTLIKAVCRETMKGGLELPIAWTRPSEEIAGLFKEVYGWEHIQTALNAGKGLLLITPHLGSYDLAGRYISQHLPFPLTAMYRPPKIEWLGEIMNAGRVRDNGRTAPANMQGVKQIVKALRSAEATIVLPDQVPGGGDGIWARFFNREAYTMTLAAKLANVSNVATLFFCGERLPNGDGFALHIEPLQGALSGQTENDVQLINDNVEAWIHRFPEQYLFSYNRFKQPAGAPPRPSEG
ncbi:lysophospholipid acyltransferase family protein [Neisseria sp. S1]|uniref:lysophospholipid acyltransferase family protein n=1 Tax=Neisseria sp. S1 TaxID=3318354 RepID=UPI003A88E0E2